MQVRGPKSGFRKTIALRRKLRHNATPAEQVFWSKVANKQYLDLKFRKQHGIGNYIVDFYCSAKKLVIEIDGDSHFQNKNLSKDLERTEYLQSLGYIVIRYNNDDVLNNIDGVFEDLKSKLSFL